MLGKQPGTLLEARLVDIHGARFYDVFYTLEASPEQARVSRIGVESVYEAPQAGDLIVLHLVLGQVTRIEKREH